jgi:hypothetical protein
MPPMRAPSLAVASACLLAGAALLAGCGGDSSSTSSTASAPDSAQSRPAPPKSEFPSAQGKSLRDVVNSAKDGPSELIISPAAMVFYEGVNRYPFGVFERDHTQVSDAEVALYFSKAPKPEGNGKSGGKGATAKAETLALDAPAIGPFPASIETLATEPAYRAKTTADDPDAASVVYSTEFDFPTNGEWRVAAVVKQGGETRGALLPSAIVGEFSNIPKPGEKAPKIHTPTAASVNVNGDLSKITTRVPPDTQNEVDYADALGKEPILLLFATPQFCQSRVCGPVVDVAEQLKHEYGDEAAFIHMEIYNDNDPSKGVRPQVRAFNLPSEPWLFAINRHGVVSSVIEGAFGPERLEAAVKKVVGE